MRSPGFIFAIFSLFSLLPATAYASTYAVIEPSRPIVTEASAAIKPLTVGDQKIIATTVHSNADDARAFVVIIEVRNSNGITENLNWQGGQLVPHESSQVGVSWIPEEAGGYEIHVFVLSGLRNPQLYSAVVISNIEVSTISSNSTSLHFENHLQHDYKEVPNLILATEDGRLFQGEEGTYCLATHISTNLTRGLCADSIEIYPQTLITLERNSVVRFRTFENATLISALPWVTNDHIEHMMTLNATNSNPTSDGYAAFAMNLPADDYYLNAEFQWTYENSEGHSYHHFRIHIQ